MLAGMLTHTGVEEREPCNKISLRMQGECFSIRHSPHVSHKCILLSWGDEQCICTGSFKLNAGKRRVLSKHWRVWHFLKTGERLSWLLFELLFIGYLFAGCVYWRWCWKDHWQDFGWLRSTGQNSIELMQFLQWSLHLHRWLTKFLGFFYIWGWLDCVFLEDKRVGCAFSVSFPILSLTAPQL